MSLGQGLGLWKEGSLAPSADNLAVLRDTYVSPNALPDHVIHTGLQSADLIKINCSPK